MKVIKDYPFALTVNSILDGINRDFGSLRWSSEVYRRQTSCVWENRRFGSTKTTIF